MLEDSDGNNLTAGDSLETEFIMIFFVSATFFTQITMLNMLIAIMGDIFDQCTEIRERLDILNRLSILNTQSAVMQQTEK